MAETRRRDSTPINDMRHRRSGERSLTPGGRNRVQVPPEVREGRDLAEKLVVEAEQFKASVQPPKGDNNSISATFQNLRAPELIRFIAENDDDDFFHLTCHVEAGLRRKIELGEFIDLDRLLPRTRTQVLKGEQAMQQFVTKSGATYWGPPERDSRITNVRRWEQAFRIYAAIFCNANPGRASEIFQYVYVINTAAVSFAWENVYFYDVTFRQLMAEKPNRSWAKTYTQLWNLAMCDHLPKNNGNSFNSFQEGGGQSSVSTGSNWKDRCCWRYNKGNKCKKWNCRYDHRCKVLWLMGYA